MRWWCVLVCCFGILSVMSAQKTDNKGLNEIKQSQKEKKKFPTFKGGF
ncbi:hypothetical protein DUHN23_01560 [Helicobacter pylori]